MSDNTKKLVITKSNQLIEARTKLSIAEQRIILYLLSQIEPHDADFKVYRISVAELNKIIGKAKGTIYESVKNVTRELIGRVMTIHQEDGPLQIAWLSKAKYIEKEGIVELRFDPDLKPYLLGIKSYFTQYELEEVLNFSNQYSWRIYELCKQYLVIGRRQITIEELRELLDLESGEYILYSNLKRRILQPTADEINKKTSLLIDWKEIKNARTRKVEGIKYTIKTKKNENRHLSKLKDSTYSEKETAKTSGIKNEIAIEKLNKYFSSEISKSLINEYGEEKCINQLGYLEKNLKYKKHIDNPSGWLKKAIEENYHQSGLNKSQDSIDVEFYNNFMENKVAQDIEEEHDELINKVDPKIRSIMERLDEKKMKQALNEK